MYDFNKIPFIGILFLVLISYVLSKVIIPSEYSKSELKIEKRDSNPYWIDTCDPYWIDTHGGNDAYSENCKNKKKEGDDIGKKCSDKGIIGTCVDTHNTKCNIILASATCSGPDNIECCIELSNNNHGGDDQTNPGGDNVNKDDDSQCIKQGGTCMNPDDCKGKGSVVPGLCSGGDDNKCCVPNKDDDSQCTKQGGTCMNPNNCKGEGSVIRDLCSSSSNYKCCLTKTVKDDFLVTKFENVVKVFLAMKYKLQNEYYETFKTPFFFTGVQNEMFLEALKIIRSKKSEGKAYVIEFTITTSTIYGMNQAYIKSISIYESDTKNDKIYFSSTTLKGKSIVTQSVDKQGLGKIINSSYDSTGTVTLGNVKSLIGKLDSRTSLSASNLEGVTVPTEEVFDDDNINFLSMNVNTASIGGFFLDMKKDDHGVYHADFDCWQRIGGYNDLYDLIFDTFTDMARNKVEFSYDGKGYALWAWKGNYINLGAGTELGFYYRNGVFDKLDFDLYGIDENRYYMPMSVKLYMNHGLIVNYSNEKSWWLTSFNPNYLGVKASQLTSEFTVTFDIGRGSKYHDEKFNDEMYKTFCNAIESRKGVDESKWVCHHDAKRTATLVF